jgi:signal transduction histidine kinase
MFFARINKIFRTVGFRIALWHSVTFAVGAVLVFAAAYLLLQRSVNDQARETNEFRMTQFANEYKKGGLPAVLELGKLRRGRAQKAAFVRLADPQNKTIFLRDAEDWAEFQPQHLAERPIPNGPQTIDLTGLDGTVLRIISRRMEDGSIMQVGRSMENVADLLSQFRIALIGIAAVVILAGVAGGTFAAFRALRPVHQVTATVRSILDTGKFTARVPSRGTGDEIDEMVLCFNTMLGKIDLLICGMRDSLDNVAHDLRTPMTRLRNIATKAVEQDYNKEHALEALGDCLEESERVVDMLVTLMDIAEAEAGVMKLENRPVNVARLVSQVVDIYEHVAEEKHITIDVDVSLALVVSGDAMRLQRAVGNLMDNAIKFTPENGRVVVRATVQNGIVGIEVADTGEGIQHEELNRIWERLYRVDKSRSKRGLGLGLSFVKAIVEAHSGKVRVDSQPGKGSRFTVELPE